MNITKSKTTDAQIWTGEDNASKKVKVLVTNQPNIPWLKKYPSIDAMTISGLTEWHTAWDSKKNNSVHKVTRVF